MGKMNVTSEVMLGLFAEMIWDEALINFRREFLYKAIDHALAEGDQESFLALTDELLALQSQLAKAEA